MRKHRPAWLEGRLASDLRALSIQQPWAWAIVHGHKSIENRPQPLPGKFLGEVVAIHASQAAIHSQNLVRAEKLARRSIDPNLLPRGAIVGFARLVGSVRRRGEIPNPSAAKWFGGPHGWLIEDVVLLDTPIPCSGALGFWRVPRRIVAQLRAATRPAPPTVFSWGYSGWGTSVRQAVARFDAVEKARGFQPPLFVDLRAQREVRATGFSGAKSPFIRTLGPKRYRWLRELGNAAISTGRGPMRLINPNAIAELLGLVVRAQLEHRRVVFFCACPSPHELPTCHRKLVGRRVTSLAARLGVPLATEEWPGGQPRSTQELVRIDDLAFDAMLAGRRWIELGRRPPSAWMLGLPFGSIVRVKSGRREGYAAVEPAAFSLGRWRLPLYLTPFAPADSKRLLREEADRWRKHHGLDSPRRPK